MSQANDILDNLTGDEIAALAAGSQIEPHIVITRDRFISVPESLRRIAVQFDKDIETVTFDCPRYWDGHDFSKMKIFINYMRADGTPGSFIAENVVIDATDDTMIHFDWTISEHVALVKGQLSFLVCINITKPDGTKDRGWHSELNKEMYISEGLECTEAIINSYPDIVTQILVVSDRANAIAETLEKNLREGNFELGLPIVDKDDEGKVLRVEDGKWKADEVHVFTGGVVHETNNSVFIRYSANADGSDFTETCHKGQYYIGVATALSAPVYASAYTWFRMAAPLEHNEYGNAFVGHISEEIVNVKDVSPIAHAIKVKVKSKNLISYPFSNTSMHSNGVTITDNGDGSITLNGTATANAEFMFRNMVKVQPGTYKYTLFGTEDISGLSGNVQKRTTGGSWVANLANTKTHNGTFTLSEDDMEYLYGFNLYIISGTVLNNVVVRPQLEIGETVTPYTPYVDPKTVMVTKCRKNLLDPRLVPNATSKGLTVGHEGNGVFHIYGTYDGSGVDVALGLCHINVLCDPDAEYTVSAKLLSGTVGKHFYAYFGVNENKSSRTNWAVARIEPTTPLGSTVFQTSKPGSKGENIRYISSFWFYMPADSVSYTVDCRVKVQLEKSPTLTEWEMYDGETYTPNDEGVIDILSVAPIMNIYPDVKGAMIDMEYNRDSNKVLDYIDKNVITAKATLKDNGAYTLTFEKGVNL